MKKTAAFFCLIAVLFSFAACAPTERTARGFSMGSDYYVTYTFDLDLDSEIQTLLSSIEESFSVKVQGSLLDRINAAAPYQAVSLSAVEYEIISRAFDISTLSDGAFNPAILPLVKVWGFDPPYEMNGKVPPDVNTVLLAKAISSLERISIDEENKTITKIDEKAGLDLGAAIKGYAAQRVAELLKEKDVAESLVYLGGTIAAVGKDYEIGVTPPRDSVESYAFRFTLKAGDVCATSGDYERYYLYNGKRYHHILDQKTGYPADSGIISATVIAQDGMVADALATAAVVLGEQKALALFEKCGASGILVNSDKKVIPFGVSVTIKDTTYEIK